MTNFIYNAWIVFAPVNQSTFHNRVQILQMLRLRKGIVKISVQSDTNFYRNFILDSFNDFRHLEFM